MVELNNRKGMKNKSELINLIKAPKILDDCVLVFAQTPDHIPFEIKRIYHISMATTKLPRGFHAHQKTQQVIFCLQGSVRIVLDNGKKRSEVVLDKPNIGLFIDKMVWHEMHNFKKNTILLVIASRIFETTDYIRGYGQFKKASHNIS